MSKRRLDVDTDYKDDDDEHMDGDHSIGNNQQIKKGRQVTTKVLFSCCSHFFSFLTLEELKRKTQER